MVAALAQAAADVAHAAAAAAQQGQNPGLSGLAMLSGAVQPHLLRTVGLDGGGMPEVPANMAAKVAVGPPTMGPGMAGGGVPGPQGAAPAAMLRYPSSVVAAGSMQGGLESAILQMIGQSEGQALASIQEYNGGMQGDHV